MRWAFSRKTAPFLLSWLCAGPPVAQATPFALAQTERSQTISDNVSASPTTTTGSSDRTSISHQRRLAESISKTDSKMSNLGLKEPPTFGPFVVLSNSQALLTRETDTDSPRDFTSMLMKFPGIKTLELSDCPGTLDDNANLELAEIIHDRGISTDVPQGGSVRSGAVDLFLAGLHRTTASDAKFAIHAWVDEDGHRPSNFSTNDPINKRYVQFYHYTAGMAEPAAVRFYDLANSVPFENALWLTPSQIAQYADITIRSLPDENNVIDAQ